MAVNRLNWQCYLVRSSKTAARILIFSTKQKCNFSLFELFFPDKKSKYLHARKGTTTFFIFFAALRAFRQEFANKCPTLGKDVCCYCSYFLFKGHLAFIEEPLEYQTSTHWAKPDFQNFILWLQLNFVFLKSNKKQNSPFWNPIKAKIRLLDIQFSPKFIFLKSNSQQNSPFWSPIFTKIRLLGFQFYLKFIFLKSNFNQNSSFRNPILPQIHLFEVQFSPKFTF